MRLNSSLPETRKAFQSRASATSTHERAKDGLLVSVAKRTVDAVNAIFDDVSLLDAVAEMNRYGPTQITVAGGDALDGLRVSGVFRPGDNAGFARAAAAW